ncbi:S-layer homology domain-containing protein [Paenibacillaceae bacterium WGS1546]|uniref:S-layer homology domain-containing protein n=1 Tax=Cohnella sp. WGS1546 TaxID=3366810 RepID=UPI00372D5544
MKKSLSLLLSLALVFGLFQSMAAAADSNLTTAQKYDELVNKGVLKGTTSGDRELERTLTRAEFATIAIAIAGLAEEKPAQATFSDVASNQWWYGAIEAAAKAELVNGTGAGKFEPRNNVTIEQVIQVAAKIVDLEPVEDAEVEGASSWAQGYIQAALDAGLIAEGLNYTADATRGQTIEVAYSAHQVLNPTEPAKVSISAKAAGVQKVAVTLDKAVDTEKATLTLQRNSSNVATKTVWAEDKKSATLELENAKIIEGDYTVTLGGISEDEIANGTASFKGENEKVVKLDFVAPSDTIAYAPKVRIQFQALNQYDEDVSLSAGSFSAYSTSPGGANVTKDANGNLYVVLKTDDSEDTSPTIIPNVSQVSVNVVNTESQMTINKVFKVGSKPYVAKVELGDVTYSNGEAYLNKSGDKAVIELIQYDQYGHRITEESGTLFNATANVVPYLAELGTPDLVDDNDDQILDVVVTLGSDAKVSGEYTVSVFGGNTASTTINVKATQYAATVELDTSVTLAAGDSGKYIGVTAYDKEGNKLSAQDIVSNYQEGHIQFTASSNLEFGAVSATLAGNADNVEGRASTQWAVVKAGEHKGKLYIAEVANTRGQANIFVNITPTSANGILFNKNFTFNIQDKRYPVGLRVTEDNAKKAIPDYTDTTTGDASSTLKLKAIDQFGDNISGAIGEIRESTRTVTYDVYVEVVSQLGGVSFSAPLGQSLDLGAVLNETALNFTAAHDAAVNDHYKVKISLRKLHWTNGAPGDVIDPAVSSFTKEMRVIDRNSRLTYEIGGIDTLFAAIDDPAMDGDADDETKSKHRRTVSISAKDGSGDKVALPAGYVTGVASSDSRIVVTDQRTDILGNRAGKTQIAITHKRADGGSQTLYKEVEVKADPISVASLSANATKQTTDLTDAATVMNLKVKDNYNTEYTGDEIADYDAVLGIRYSISDIQATNGGWVRVNHAGAITFSNQADVQSFTLTASAPNGQIAVTAVINAPAPN